MIFTVRFTACTNIRVKVICLQLYVILLYVYAVTVEHSSKITWPGLFQIKKMIQSFRVETSDSLVNLQYTLYSFLFLNNLSGFHYN